MSKIYGNNTAESSELKHMVMSFRVAELRVLLSVAGRNKSGRKHDLMTRALQMLKSECTSEIKKQIKLLYSSRYPRNTSQFESLVHPYEKHIFAPTASVHESSMDSKTPVPVSVKFITMPFYELMSEVIRPCKMVPQNHSSQGYLDVRCTFRLNSDMVEEIQRSSTGLYGKTTSEVQVQLRFCEMPMETETQSEQKDCLPPNLTVKVNRQMASLPPFLPPTKAGQEPRRANRAINISEHCKLYYLAENVLDITWSANSSKPYSQNYVLVINVVRKLTYEILLNKLKKHKVRPSKYSQSVIRDKLSCDPDSDISATSLKVSLLCPLGKMRMRTPGRPVTCTHVQCFDLATFLQMNEKRPTWSCPVCDQPALYKNLIVDGLFLEILKESDHEEIEFANDGMWKPIRKEKEKTVPESNDDDTVVCSSNEGSPRPDTNKSKRKSDVIDLTLDSSDDEGEPLSRKSPSYYPSKKSCSYAKDDSELPLYRPSLEPFDTLSPNYSPVSPSSKPPKRGHRSQQSLSPESATTPSTAASISSNNNSPAPGAIGSLLNNLPGILDNPLDFSMSHRSSPATSIPLFHQPPYGLGGRMGTPFSMFSPESARLYQEMFTRNQDMFGRSFHPPSSISPSDIIRGYQQSYSPLSFFSLPHPNSNSGSSGVNGDDVIPID